MIKKIYIYYGSVASLFPLLACGKNNHDLLLEQGIYFPQLKDFIESYTNTLDVYDQTWHAWLQNVLQKQYSEKNARIATRENIEAIVLSGPQEYVDNLAHFIKTKDYIHTLYLCIDAYVYNKYCQTTLTRLEAAFPNAQLHTRFFLLSPDRELEGYWIYRKHFSNIGSADSYILSSKNKNCFLYNSEKTYKAIHDKLNSSSVYYLEDEKQALDILLKDISLNLGTCQCETLFSSPKVLSFIQQFPKAKYPHGHPVYWWQEKDFLQYGREGTNPFSYLTSSQRKEVRENHARLSSLKFVYGEEQALDENVSCIDEALTPQDALAMASLISPALRQELISHIDIDTLPHEDDTRRFVYGALLFTEGIIDESVWSSLQAAPSTAYVENIYLHFADTGSTSILSEYCHNNKEALYEQGLYYPQLHDILPENIKAPLHFGTCGHMWLYQDAAMLTLEQNRLHYFLSCKNRMFAKQNAYLVQQASLRSICFLLQITDSSSDIQSFIKCLQTHYPTAKLHINIQLLSPDKQIEHIWIQSICQKNSCPSLAHWVQNTHRDENVFHHVQNVVQYLQQNFQEAVHISLIDSEENVLKQWQNFICLSDSTMQALSRFQYLPSPKVIAFILSVQRMHERSTPMAWFAERDFWSYEQEEQAFSYLRPYWKQVVRDNFEKSTNINIKSLGQPPYKDVSDTPLSITFSQALSLASLLSKQCREHIVQDIDFSTVQYKDQTTRSVYAALLLVEKRITQEQAGVLAQEIKGQILTHHAQMRLETETLPPKVTVLTMAYNHEKYIARCIESVAKQQTHFPVAHVIIDDFSTDGTRDILLEYAKKYSHITLIFNEYNDPATVACKLFDNIPSEYVALCDGDDYFHDPLKLQKQVNLLDENPRYGLCSHLVMTLFEDMPDVGKIFPPMEYMPRGVQPKYYVKELLELNFIQTNSAMYRWRFKNQGLPAWYAYGTCPSDRYWHLIHAELGPVGFINEIMSVYWRHNKGHFYEAEVNPLGHRNTYGIQEITLYNILDIHFEGRYTQICHSLSKNVLGDVANLLQKTQDPMYLKEVLKVCPALKQYVVKQKR